MSKYHHDWTLNTRKDLEATHAHTLIAIPPLRSRNFDCHGSGDVGIAKPGTCKLLQTQSLLIFAHWIAKDKPQFPKRSRNYKGGMQNKVFLTPSSRSLPRLQVNPSSRIHRSHVWHRASLTTRSRIWCRWVNSLIACVRDWMILIQFLVVGVYLMRRECYFRDWCHILGIGLFFSAFMILLTAIQARYTGFSPKNSEEFSSASRRWIELDLTLLRTLITNSAFKA